MKAIATTIAQFNPSGSDRFASKIRMVADCFGIDSFVFTGLIQQESKFDPATFGKNGVGLAQMTSLGIKEVHHQLDLCDKKSTSECSGEGSKAAIMDIINSCVIPHFNAAYPSTVSALNTIGKKKLSRKSMLDENINLVYSAILLKVQLFNNKGAGTLANIYRQALIDYNGNTKRTASGKTQIRYAYAKIVMSNAERIKVKAVALGYDDGLKSNISVDNDEEDLEQFKRPVLTAT